MSSDRNSALKSRVWNRLSELRMPTKQAVMHDLAELENSWPSWGWIPVGFSASIGLVVGFLIGLFYMGAF